MNREAKERWERDQRKHLLVKAAELDEFSVGELWEHCNRLPRYGRVAELCREWWIQGLLVRKDRDGLWYPWVNKNYGGRGNQPLWTGRAVYKWVD